MAGTVNPAEQRAYREGVVDQKLASHDVHFAEINGSIARAAGALVEVEKTVSRLVDQVQGLVITMPSIQKLASETATSADTAERVAAALLAKTDAERTRWDRYRNVVAWSLGVVIATVTIANFTTRLLGVAAPPPPASTVTVQDVTPGSP